MPPVCFAFLWLIFEQDETTLLKKTKIDPILIAQKFAKENEPSFENLVAILRAFDNIPCTTLDQNGFFKTLCNLNTIGTLKALQHTSQINRKQKAYLERAYLEFKAENNLTDNVYNDVEKYIENISRDLYSYLKKDVLRYYLNCATNQQFQTLVTIISKAHPLTTTEIYLQLNDTERILHILEKIQNKQEWLLNNDLLELILKNRILSEEDKINFVSTVLSNDQNRTTPSILQYLCQEYNKNGVAHNIIQRFITSHPERIPLFLNHCIKIIFEHFVINGVDQFHTLLQQALTNSEHWLNDPEVMLLLLRNIATNIELVINSEQIQRTITFLSALIDDNDRQLQQRYFDYLHNYSRKYSVIIRNYIALMAGRHVLIEIKENQENINPKLIENLKTLSKKTPEPDKEKWCKKFMESCSKNYFLHDNFGIDGICVNLSPENISILLSTTQNLLCTDFSSYQKYASYNQVVQKLGTFSQYKENPRVFNGHWLRRMIKIYRTAKARLATDDALKVVQSSLYFNQFISNFPNNIDTRLEQKNHHIQYFTKLSWLKI